ncbi:hypothetical protein G3O06_01045 [Burkholderia sp. Ac-20345]|uniref:hypothetical protein n=1 Tax=Burkholderia sp. Ac-20345 TaxID=2703891 RepID=UPI00197B39B8|nr:hypothetical protein [Burkholderia sp. Ac-20345]MBN3776153.1 hypothetical protein [Burkholderia sp. Ac-20345]
MRTYFRNTKRPKLVAESLTAAFPNLQYATALEWVATIFGYRNWHELQSSVNEFATPTPLFSLLDPDAEDFERLHELYEHQVEKLQELLGDEAPYAEDVVAWTLRADNQFILSRPKRLIDVPHGTPRLQAFAADDRFFPCESPGVDYGSNDYGKGECFACYETLPQDMDATEMIAEFVARIRAVRGASVAALAETVCRAEVTSPVVECDASLSSVIQYKDLRLILVDRETRNIRGCGVFRIGIYVGPPGKGCLITCDAKAVVVEGGYNYLSLQLATVVLMFFKYAFDVTRWMQFGEKSESVAVEIDEDVADQPEATEVLDAVYELWNDEIDEHTSEIAERGSLSPRGAR